MTPGWKTSEFWVTIATTLWAAFSHVLPPAAQAVVVAVVPGAYSIARAISKAAQSHADAAKSWEAAPMGPPPVPRPLPSPSVLHHLDGS